MTNDYQTEAEAVAELAFKIADRTQALTPDTHDVQVTVRDRDEVADYRTFEQFLRSPRRQRGTYTTATADSFIDLTNHLDLDDLVVYHDKKDRRFVAVLNHDTWRDHTVGFIPAYTREFKAWYTNSDDLMKQSVFAEFLEDHARDILSPTPADMVALARTFTAKKNVEFEGGQHLQNGDVQLTYSENTTANAGRKSDVKIPETFTLGVPVFEGTDAVEIAATFRWRITKDGLFVGYKLRFVDETVDAVFNLMGDKISTGIQSGLHVEGKAPIGIDAWQ